MSHCEICGSDEAEVGDEIETGPFSTREIYLCQSNECHHTWNRQCREDEAMRYEQDLADLNERHGRW